MLYCGQYVKGEYCWGIRDGNGVKLMGYGLLLSRERVFMFLEEAKLWTIFLIFMIQMTYQNLTIIKQNFPKLLYPFKVNE